MNFRSDNTASAHPKVLDHLSGLLGKHDKSYGADLPTKQLRKLLSDVFETNVLVFPMATGTAANALALAAITPRFSAIACHTKAHIFTDECAAPSYFCGGSPLIPVGGAQGKIDVAQLDAVCRQFPQDDDQCSPIKTLSVTQASESGTVYSLPELDALSGFARARGLNIHMDGARFSNALVSLACSPAEMTWKRGVDVLSLGATKNGTFCAEAIVFFDDSHATDFTRQLKRSGHLLSKQRFVSEQLLALFMDGLWLETALAANTAAQSLFDALLHIPEVQIDAAPQANIIVARIPEELALALEREGVWFRRAPSHDDGRCECRFVTSFETNQSEIKEFQNLVHRFCNQGERAASQ